MFIPSIFARVVERDAWALGVCADYLEDRGIDASILRVMENPCSALEESAYCFIFRTDLYRNLGSGYYYGYNESFIFSGGGSSEGVTNDIVGGEGDGCSDHLYLLGLGDGGEGFANGNGTGCILYTTISRSFIV